MKYVSTRGRAPPIGFLEALLAGLAPDGGLYVPETWPRLSKREITAFAGRPYAQVAADILQRFAGEEIAPKALICLCAEAYAGFDHAAVVPLRQSTPGEFVLELFHGPTLAFKDIAMQIMARLYEHALIGTGRTLTIVCATSGDTGGAAVEAFRGRAGLRIVALYPQGRISEVQRRFMTTAEEANVRAVAVDGDFDACQAMVKAMFADAAFAREVDLSAANSINIVRVIAQCVYYFTAAVALGGPDLPIRFAVPTGNFGDAYAGHAAARMGLPIDKIVAATNANDILARALETGLYQRGPVVATQSPAMDIQVASNFERLYFECVQRDGDETAAAFEMFDATGALEVPPRALERMREAFTGVAVSETRTTATMADVLRETGETLDPHTAVAMAGARQAAASSIQAPTVILATAHAAKFPDAVRAATGAAPAPPALVRERMSMAERFDELPADAEVVKAYLRDFVARRP